MATDRSQKCKALADKAKSFVTLAHTYRPGKDNIEGWVASEKLDGVRARWVDGQLLSRNMKPFPVPADVLRQLGNEIQGMAVDGELWCGRGQFQKTISIVKNSHSTMQDWDAVQYRIFDVVGEGDWWTRRKPAFDLLEETDRVFWHEHSPVKNLDEWSQRVFMCGGEGLILRNPNAPYTFGRSRDLLKVKCSEECEVTVFGHQPGEGKHAGRLGALICLMAGVGEFKVGTGFTDAERENPPPVGSKVTIRYMGLTDDGIPREPRFLAVRDYE